MNKNKFPEDLKFARDYCFFINNIILSTVESAYDSLIFEHNIEFENDEQKIQFKYVLENKDYEQYRDWFRANDKLTDLYFITLKGVLLNLIIDFNNYIYEALEIIQHGNYSVAYTVLRKPFKENLLLLEWIIADPVEFMFKYSFLDSTKYAPLNFFGKKDKLLNIMGRAIKKLKHPSFFDSEVFYQLRYSKRNIHSFDNLWNKSTHLVTTRNNIKTDTWNLNFVFLTEENRENLLHHLYSFLPLLLFYSSEIVDQVLKNIAKLGKDDVPLRRMAGFIVCFEEAYLKGRADEKIFKKQLSKFRKELAQKCPNCSSQLTFTTNNMKLYCLEEKIICQNCSHEISLGKK